MGAEYVASVGCGGFDIQHPHSCVSAQPQSQSGSQGQSSGKRNYYFI
jgi:hypothetical protein